MERIKEFLKKETVLAAAAVLALVSVFFVPPSAAYLDYIDFRVLALLFCLMAVMAGLREMGVFSFLAGRLLQAAKSGRSVELILVLLCFFSSMVITNDVALLTFVPFAMEVLSLCGREKRILFVVVMQTVAANLGSMLTPLGNPQNLYLYSLSGMGAGELLSLMAPYAGASLVMILLCMVFSKNGGQVTVAAGRGASFPVKMLILYGQLFVLSLLTVLRILPYQWTLAATVLALLLADRKILKKVDYSLLVTFVCFFVLVGNIGRIDAVREALGAMVQGNEVAVSVAASQVISNVPAALLLSGFTQDYRGLLVGVNLGGLGTLIASMASLISYKFYAASYGEKKGKYLLVFTLVNLAFLFVLLLLNYGIGA